MINLVPQNAQHRLLIERRNRALSAFGFFVTGIMATGFVMLLPSFIALRYLTQDFLYAREVEERSPVSRALEERGQELTQFESLARSVLSQAHTTPSFEDMVREIIRITPSDINLLTMRFEKNTFTIDGHYQRRASFLAFLEALKTSAFVKNISSPLSNLLKEADAPFHLTLSL